MLARALTVLLVALALSSCGGATPQTPQQEEPSAAPAATPPPRSSTEETQGPTQSRSAAQRPPEHE